MGDQISAEERRLIDLAIAAGQVQRVERDCRRVLRGAYDAGHAFGAADNAKPALAMAAPCLATDAAPRPGRVAPVAIGIEALLHWAFGREHARLDFDDLGLSPLGYGYVSSMVAIAEHEQLGCRVSGGGQSRPHDDAEAVAAAVAALPRSLGGRAMALSIAEHARAGTRPDAMIDVVQRYQPVSWTSRGAGGRRKGAVERLPRVSYVERGRVRLHDRPFVPVTLRPSAQEIAAKRRAWLAWWGALRDLRAGLSASGDLRGWVLTDEMPPRAPWSAKGVDARK
jgi:hypothetical protein